MRLVAALALLSLAAPGWERSEPMPEPRTEVAAAALHGEIVVVGGLLPTGANSRLAHAFSPRSKKWRRLPDLPVSVDHAAVASARGTLYVVGGYDTERQPLRAAFSFNGMGDRRRARPRADGERRRGVPRAALSNS